MEFIKEKLKTENYSDEKIQDYSEKYYKFVCENSTSEEEIKNNIATLVSLNKKERNKWYLQLKNKTDTWDSFLIEGYKKDIVFEDPTSEVKIGEFQCKRCKERKCTYYQLQNRSCDESMNTYITCINCGNRWKL